MEKTLHDNRIRTREALETLDRFLALIDSGELFAGARCPPPGPGPAAGGGKLGPASEPKRPEDEPCARWRREVTSALSHLLVWGRPELEAGRSLDWPYQALKLRYPLLAERAGHPADPDGDRQARLFLALLPFPNQWSWLLGAEKSSRDDPEMRGWLAREKRKVDRKLAEKADRSFKLRHFCQVLKSCRDPEEKGVLRVFSLPYLFLDRELLERLGSRYVFYVEPPMGVVFRHAWWRYFCRLEDPCLFGVGGREDREFLATQPHVEAHPLAHGDFLEDRSEPELAASAEKAFDIVFNATFDDMPRKRHRLMLETLLHPALRRATALFLGRGRPEQVERFEDLTRSLGLESRVTVLANLRRTAVPGHLVRARVGVHLSLYENNCRSIYEFLRADLPCVVSSCMAGLNYEIINSETGLAVPDQDLPGAIAEVLAEPRRFAPQRWFQRNSGSARSTERLNRLLKDLFLRRGYRWRDDIASLVSSGASRYASAADHDRFLPDFRWILSCMRESPSVAVELTIA